jgi:hypothetical protein
MVPGEQLSGLWLVIFGLLTAGWVVLDAEARQIRWGFDFGFYIFQVWPIALPYYMVKTRGAIGFAYALVFTLFAAAPFLTWYIGVEFFYEQ